MFAHLPLRAIFHRFSFIYRFHHLLLFSLTRAAIGSRHTCGLLVSFSLFLISFFFPYLRSIGVEFLSSSFFSAGNRTIFDWIVYYWKLEKESGLVRGTYSMIGLSGFAFFFLFWVNRVDLITSSSPSLNLFKFYSTNTRIRSKIFFYVYAWDKICWQDFY